MLIFFSASTSEFVGSTGFYATIGAGVLCVTVLAVTIACIVKCKKRKPSDAGPADNSNKPAETPSYPMAPIHAHQNQPEAPMDIPPPYYETENRPSAPPYFMY